MNRHKVKAFTLMELSITMLITALVTGITYSAYTIISKYYISFNKKHNDLSAIIQLDELIKRDFEHADTIYKDGYNIIFINSEGTSTLEFTPDYLLRIASRTDTFKFKTEGLLTNFENGRDIENSPVDSPVLIDELTFKLLYQNETISYHYHKHYSSKQLIQQNTDALN